jgi:hypothetical protein
MLTHLVTLIPMAAILASPTPHARVARLAMRFNAEFAQRVDNRLFSVA